MHSTQQRAALEQLARERREDYAGLSRLIGRNPAYIQQFIKRGVPRRLAEADRRTLARYFGVDESVLGGPHTQSASDNLVPIPQLDVRASAGPGAIDANDAIIGEIAFTRARLRQLCGARPHELSIIRVNGDSMTPTLADGDEILVDQSEAGQRLRDGIYVLRQDDAVVVKRLAVNPSTRGVTVRSDNPAYPDWPDCRPSQIAVLGRVIWAGRRIS